MDYLVQKWACQYCTYENWPASKFCVLCRAPKPAMYIDDSGLQKSEDPRKTNLPEGEQCFPHQEKWSCPACTFLNWPKSVKCTQCYMPRKAVESPETLKKSIGESQSYDANNSSESDECQLQSPEPEKATTKNPSKINTKWSCSFCTYKNWFQTRYCTYCGTSKHKCKQLSRKLRVTQENEINKISSDPSAVGTGRVILEENLENLSLGVGAPQGKPEEKRGQSLEAVKPEMGKKAGSPQVKEDDQPFLDWLWLAACRGVLEDDIMVIEEYLASGGDPARAIAYSDLKLLGRPSAFTAGFTLVHLAIRFKREQILALLLTATDASNKAKKRVPSLVAYEIANQINRELRLCLEQKRRHFRCYHFGELSTFLLPAEIHTYHPLSRKLLFEELLDENAQKELEEEKVINWSQELISLHRCRLFPLWNRTAGDCLLDSILQATWGIMDTDNVLRQALFNSLVDCREEFYSRWREHELIQADLMNYTLNENQLRQDWETLLMHAKHQGSSLEQVHILVLAHILRRPIIVYGIKYVKNLHGDNIGYAGFQGVYLPLFWDPSYCWRTPIALGYTRGHFSALVSTEPDVRSEAATSSEVTPEDVGQVINLPLMDSEEKLLPIHFLAQNDRGLEEAFLYQWLDCLVTDGGLLVCQQRSFRSHILSREMVNQWLEKYRNFSKMFAATSRFSDDEGEI